MPDARPKMQDAVSSRQYVVGRRRTQDPRRKRQIPMTKSQFSMTNCKVALFLVICLLLLCSLVSAETGGEKEGVRERLVSYLDSRDIPRELIVTLVSMLPIVELRGAIPVGIVSLGLPWWSVYGWAVLGNLIPVVPLLLFLGVLSRAMSKLKGFSMVFPWLFERTRRRSGIVEQYESLGLMLFVAIPLPVTGAWTGSIAAFLFGIRFRRALPAIALGVLIAGVVVTLLSLLGWRGAVIAGVAILALASWRAIRIKHPS